VDFVAVVDQAIALLRQRGRLTYRTLQRQFQLDDAALDDLKDELIYGQRLAADEAGRVLVWTGDPGGRIGKKGATYAACFRDLVNDLGMLRLWAATDRCVAA
jgi:hypothetical protein